MATPKNTSIKNVSPDSNMAIMNTRMKSSALSKNGAKFFTI